MEDVRQLACLRWVFRLCVEFPVGELDFRDCDASKTWLIGGVLQLAQVVEHGCQALYMLAYHNELRLGKTLLEDFERRVT